MGIGNDLIGDVEEHLLRLVISRKKLFRFHGKTSFVYRFEQEIEQTFYPYQSLMLPSASCALALLLYSLKLPKESEILIAPLGWVANYSVIHLLGYSIKFVPLDENLAIRAEMVEQVISPKTQVLLVAHLMGRAQPYIRELATFCEHRGLHLIEDIAQSFGVRLGSQPVGTFGIGAYTSFNHHKILSTGDGGLVICKNPEVFQRIQQLHDQGCLVTEGKRTIVPGAYLGLSLRVNETSGAVALAQLSRLALLRVRIWKLYQLTYNIICQKEYLRIIETQPGDLPFTLLFETEKQVAKEHPSLAESGWHVANNIPYLSESVKLQIAENSELEKTFNRLQSIYSLGTGFIDKYFATPLGLSLESREIEQQEFMHVLEKLL